MTHSLEVSSIHEDLQLPGPLQPYFNLEPGYYYRHHSGSDPQALAQLPFIPIDRIAQEVPLQRSMPAFREFPVERIVAAARPMENWAAKNEQKLDQHGRTITSAQQVINFLNQGNYKEQEPPIMIAPFVDSRGEVWGIVHDGTHRVMSAKLAGERTINANVYDSDPAQMSRYAGDVISETRHQGRPLYDPDQVPERLRNLSPTADIRNIIADINSEAAWERLFSSPIN